MRKKFYLTKIKPWTDPKLLQLVSLNTEVIISIFKKSYNILKLTRILPGTFCCSTCFQLILADASLHIVGSFLNHNIAALVSTTIQLKKIEINLINYCCKYYITFVNKINKKKKFLFPNFYLYLKLLNCITRFLNTLHTLHTHLLKFVIY